MTNKHQVFAQSLRKIMRNEEKNSSRNNQKRSDENRDENSISLQEMLEAKYEELFGSVDEDDD